MNKTFEVKLLDNGIREYRDDHSSVKCQICSRDKFKNLSIQDENHSLYFLKGFHNGKLTFYVGRSKKIKSRLNDHTQKKEFWEEVIIFTKKDDENGFIKEIEQLEKYYIEIIDKSYYDIKNKDKIYNKKLLEYSEVRIVESINDFLVILGYELDINNVTGKKLGKSTIPEVPREFNEFFIKKPVKNRGFCDAKMINNNGIFTILKGSLGVKNITESFKNHSSYKERLKLIKEGIIKEYEDRIEFAEDYSNKSNSPLASIVLGNPSSGNKQWEKLEVNS